MADHPVLPPHPVLVAGWDGMKDGGTKDGDTASSGGSGTSAWQMSTTRELLGRVGQGAHPPALRVYRPGPTLAFSRRETHRPGYATAVASARRHGFEPVVRNTGGQAVAYGPGSLVVELLAADPSPAGALRARFAAFGSVLAGALGTLGVAASVGRLDGEYCPGDFSVLGSGRVKLAGTAQRLTAHAWLCSASVIVESSAPLREVLTGVYRHLAVHWRPETLAAVADLVPGTTVAAVESAVITAFAPARTD